MGWLSTDYIQLEILMHLDVLRSTGRGYTRWTPLNPHPSLSDPQACIALAALNYGRALVNHAETRAELFSRVGHAASALANGTSALNFGQWNLEVGGLSLPIWPWSIDTPENLLEAKVYVARLRGSRAGTLSINLKMAWGQERILAPVAALLPLYLLSDALGGPAKLSLASTLLAMNRFYGSPEAAGRLGSDSKAVAAALPALTAGGAI